MWKTVINFFFFSLVLNLFQSIHAQEQEQNHSKKQPQALLQNQKNSKSFGSIVKSKLDPKKNLTAHPIVPALKKGEYAVFINDAYLVFKTQKFDSLELATNCFKQNKPQCEAYAMAKIKPKEIESLGGATNIAAVNCENMNGRNMIALDLNRSEYNFCRYKDGSMVNSWSMYKYHNPVPVIK